MSSSLIPDFTNSGLRLLVKYIGLKHLYVGSLSDNELDFLKNMIALNEAMYHTILHTFNKPKVPMFNGNTVLRNNFLKGYYKYYDVSHKLWSEKGLCPKLSVEVDRIKGKSPSYARLYNNDQELQVKGYSYQYRRISMLNIPWKNLYYNGAMKKIRNECVFHPHIVTHKNENGENVIKGLYVRIEKCKVIKFLKDNKLYGVSTTNATWGNNVQLKSTFRNISCEQFKCSHVGRDMKTILTPIKLENDDSLSLVYVPKAIHKHHSKEVLLKRYQLANVEWMVNLENNLKDYSITVDKTVEIMPNVYFDHLNDIVYDSRQSRMTLTPKGGGIFDEVGLGKTLTCITLICSNKPSKDIGCKQLKTKVINTSQPTCQAMVKSGKRVKENGGNPVVCGRIIKAPKSSAPKSSSASSSTKKSGTTTTKKQKVASKSLAFLLKHNVCTMHSRSIKDNVSVKSTTTTTTVQPPKTNEEKIDSSGVNVKKMNGRWMSKATLVVCPNQIPYQWVSQIKEYTDPVLKVFTITNLHEARKLTYRDIINADVIITTIDCIERGTVTSASADGQSMSYTKEIAKINLDTNCPSFDLVWWHRIMFDEMHRVTNNKYRNAITRIFRIPSTYKWTVTGTPFEKDQLNYDIMVSWLYSNDNIGYNKNSRQRVFSKLQTNSDILTSIFRRNTKKSTEHLTPLDGGKSIKEKQQKLWQTVTQTEVWLDLSKIERAMYNARKASKPYWTKDRDDEYLRQICCHPNLSAENSKIVHAVNNSKTRPTGYGGTNANSRYSTNANDVKKALLDHNQQLIKQMIEKDIPDRIKSSWDSQAIYLADKKDKKNRMAYYGTVHQMKRAFFKLYQLRKSNRAYTDVYNRDTSPIVIQMCDGCLKNITVSRQFEQNVDIHVGECGHVFCKNCAAPKFISPFVDVTESPKKKSKKSSSGKRKKVYEKKITEGYATCGVCSQALQNKLIKCRTIGMTDAIKVDPRELLMDMYSESTDVSDSESMSDSEGENGDENKLEYIPKKFKEEMDCAIGLYGTKVTHLIAYLKTYTSKPHNHRIIIFSQWDNLLLGIMETLKNFDLPAMMCKGNVFQKKKAIENFKTNSYYKIILLSSKYAASGLDLIEANKVIFIDPVYGDFDTVKQIEDQAIGRAHRLGQQNPIEVVRFLIKDSIEEECHKDWKKSIDIKTGTKAIDNAA